MRPLKRFHQNFTKDPKVAPLGVMPEDRAKKYLSQILLTAAITHITIKWLNCAAGTWWLLRKGVVTAFQGHYCTRRHMWQKETVGR